jgi:hypothetical protein
VIAGILVFMVAIFAVGLQQRNVRRNNAVSNRDGTQKLNLRMSQGAMDQVTSDDLGDDADESSRLRWLFEQLGMLRAALTPPVRTLITYAQVTGQLSHVLHVQYPKNFTSAVSRFQWLKDVWSLVFSPECAGYGSFYDKWMLRVVCQPLLFGFVATSVYCVDSCFSLSSTANERWNKWRQNLLRAVFLCYPSVCNVAFSALDCRYDGPDSKVLVDDDRIRCGTSTHEMFKWFSILVICVFGCFMPVFFGYRVWHATSSAEDELSRKQLVYNRAETELLPPQMDAQEQAQRAWRRTWKSKCLGSCCSEYKTPSDVWMKKNAKLLDWKQHKASRKVAEKIEGAFIESTRLGHYVSLTEAYKPDCWSVYWEAVDMLRKLTLVGLVVLAGRGSVAQNMCSSIFSFFFFALHVKMWPMKMVEDNILRASCEFHVFWTITTAFVMKSDLSHESLKAKDYDDALLLTFVLCVPGAFCATMFSKYRRTRNVVGSDLSMPEYSKSQIPGSEFVRFSIGLAISDDRTHLREYFEIRSTRMTQVQVCDDSATEVLDHHGRTTLVLDTSQLGVLLERLCRPTDVEGLERVDDIDISSWQPGQVKLLLASTSDASGETREVVQVWKWSGPAEKGEWQIHREIEKTDNSLVGQLDVAEATAIHGTYVQLRSDAGKKGVALRRAWCGSKICVDFGSSGGTQEWVHRQELIAVALYEPALDDPGTLRMCELDIQHSRNHLPGHLESVSTAEEDEQRRLSRLRTTSVDFFEFIAWWERRQGQRSLEQRRAVHVDETASHSELGQPLLGPSDPESESDTRIALRSSSRGLAGLA